MESIFYCGACGRAQVHEVAGMLGFRRPVKLSACLGCGSYVWQRGLDWARLTAADRRFLRSLQIAAE